MLEFLASRCPRMSGSCCARLRRANVEFAAVERPSKAVVPKSVQIASAVAYATAHEACAAHAKTRLAAPLRSFAAPLRSPTVFLRVQHMASCADRPKLLAPRFLVSLQHASDFLPRHQHARESS